MPTPIQFNNITIWRVIFGGAKFREKPKPTFRINFHDFNFHDCHLNERAALRGCTHMYDHARPLGLLSEIKARSEELLLELH